MVGTIAAQVALPTAELELFGRRVEVLLFGRGTGRWSIKDSNSRDRMAAVARACGVTRLFGVDPSGFNAVVQQPLLDNAAGIEGTNPVFAHGFRVDGLAGLQPKNGVVMCTADCPTVLLFDQYGEQGRQVAVLHAGLDSLIVRHWVDRFANCDPDRPSVIQTAVGLFEEPRRLQAAIVLGIRSLVYPVDHPDFGEVNQRLFEEFEQQMWFPYTYDPDDPGWRAIHLHDLIKLQLVAAGVSEGCITSDTFDTFSDISPGGSIRRIWHSHARWAETRDGEDGRNLVLVKVC